MGIHLLLKEGFIQLSQFFFVNGRTFLDYIHAGSNAIFQTFLYITIGLTLLYLFLTVFSLFTKQKSKEISYDVKDAPTVTVQIPTRNEIIALRCAEHCLKFDYPKEKFDVIIGDDSDDPKISLQLNEFAAHHNNVQIIKRDSNSGFKPGNLNNMLPHSKGDILVIFDSDFSPAPDFLKRIVAPFVHDKEVSSVQAKWNFNNFNQNFVTVLSSTIVYVFHHIVLAFMNRFQTASLCGSAEAIRKKDLIELGGWTSGSLTEDIDFALRLYKNDKKMVYIPTLECNSEVPYKAQDLYKQQMRWGYGVIASYKKHLPSILLHSKLSLKKKIISLGPGFGYMLPLLIFMLFTFGTITLVTHRPAPLDLYKFSTELAINIALTSGLLIASIVSLHKARKAKAILKMLIASFSIGLVTTYYVNIGIFKALFNKPMKWYLLSKDVE